jgi:hypothetical protein
VLICIYIYHVTVTNHVTCYLFLYIYVKCNLCFHLFCFHFIFICLCEMVTRVNTLFIYFLYFLCCHPILVLLYIYIYMCDMIMWTYTSHVCDYSHIYLTNTLSFLCCVTVAVSIPAHRAYCLVVSRTRYKTRNPCVSTSRQRRGQTRAN